MNNKKGFTFIEVLVVVGIITLLTTTVITIVNPAKRFEQARDRQREIHLQSILSAVETKKTIERGWLSPCEEIPQELDEVDYPIFKTIGTKAEPGFYDLYQCLVPVYLSTELVDPLEGSKEDTKYQIWQNPYSKRVTLLYVKDDKRIVAGPDEYWVLNAPIVVSADVGNITHNSADSGGEVTDDGDSVAFERGMVWNTFISPTIYDNRTVDGSGIGIFTSAITKLETDTVYYVRAYARNDIGIGYGQEKEFRTCTPKPTIETLEAIDVTNASAVIQGEITCVGTDESIRYFEWGPTQDYDYDDINVGTGGLGVFSYDLTGLVVDQTYYFRACAENSAGVLCGEQKSFTTFVSKPSVTTTDITDITDSSAVLGGVAISDGGASIIAKGVCWNMIGSDPTIDDTCINVEPEVGPFTADITGIDPGTTYYVRAYAENEIGIGYGEVKNFTTDIVPATITTTNITNVTDSSADSGGEVTHDGGGDVTARGVCWNTTGNPTINHDCTSNGTGKGGFTSEIQPLISGVTYYVRAYATNNKEAVTYTAYGQEEIFITLAGKPHVTTRDVSAIAGTSATSGGNVTYDGGGDVTAKGVCWSAFSDLPNINDDSCMNSGSGTGPFISDITELDPATTYHVRAYATNAAGTNYGESIEFSTVPIFPTLDTVDITDVNYNSAVSGGNIISDGGGYIIIKGVCWTTFGDPTIADTCTDNGEGAESFISNITGLVALTTYRVRAYATNETGTNYGETKSFTTSPPQAPELTTKEITNIGRFSADSGGNVVNNGGASITARGVCWNTTGSPTITDSHTQDSAGMGLFDSYIVNLNPNTFYYVRAYATTSMDDTGYGQEQTFQTNSLSFPVLSTENITNITYNSADSGGEIIDYGGASIVNKGVCWNVFGSPTTADTCTNNGTGSNSFISNLTGLAKGAAYYVRAYAENSQGVGYGNQKSFNTNLTLPTVITADINNITGTSADSGGEVTDHGGDSNVLRGVCWNITGSPSTADNCTEDGTGQGLFISNMTNLAPGITYYVRAYAANSEGTSYGEQKDFMTNITVPIVITADTIGIDPYSAAGGGEVISDGGAPPVKNRGVCWNLYGTPTIDDECTSNGTGTGAFDSNIINLYPGTVYYVRAYAINESGATDEDSVGYGEVKTFSTEFPDIPTVTTAGVTNVMGISADSGGEVTDDGGDPNTLRGVCWKTAADGTAPKYGIHDHSSDGTGMGIFSSNIIGLAPGTAYYVRAYAHNITGTGYGTLYSFVTPTGPCQGIEPGGNPGNTALSCSVRSSNCLAGETTVLKMSATANAHVELPGQVVYDYYVCCNGNDLDTACEENYDTVLKLSSQTNAHVEKNTQVNYAYPACLSTTHGSDTPSPSTIVCDYIDASDCSGLGPLYTCLASISGDTNAHIGDCNTYTTKVCCANVCP